VLQVQLFWTRTVSASIEMAARSLLARGLRRQRWCENASFASETIRARPNMAGPTIRNVPVTFTQMRAFPQTHCSEIVGGTRSPPRGTEPEGDNGGREGNPRNVVAIAAV